MRFKLFVLTLATMAVTACGNKNGGGNPEPAPQGPLMPEQISEDELRGKPGNFAGTWRGDCSIEVGPHRSTSCKIILKIRQDRNVIDITQETRASFGGGEVQAEKAREVFNYRHNTIQGREGRNGAIGPKVLTVVTPPSASNNGQMVRTTLRKLAPNVAQLSVDTVMGNERATVRAELRVSARPLPRARSTSRN